MSSLAAVLASPASGVSEAVTGYPIGRGNGVDSVFTAPPEITAISALYRRDWQGNVALSASPRTNYFTQSENLTYFGNNSGTPTYTTTEITDDSPSVLESAYRFATVPVDSNQYCATVIVAKNAPNIVCVAWKLEGGTSTNRHNCAIDTVTGKYKAWDAVTNLSVPCTVDDLGSIGWAVTLYPQNNGTNNVALCTLYPAWASSLGTTLPVAFNSTLNGTAGFTKIMLSQGTVRGSYIPTTTAPVTVTDYSASGTTLTLAEAPAFAAELTVDGTGVNLPLLQIGGY